MAYYGGCDIYSVVVISLYFSLFQGNIVHWAIVITCRHSRSASFFDRNLSGLIDSVALDLRFIHLVVIVHH
eukprot:scaffold6187_cov139-Skeletonema_menzelii.AAC.1